MISEVDDKLLKIFTHFLAALRRLSAAHCTHPQLRDPASALARVAKTAAKNALCLHSVL